VQPATVSGELHLPVEIDRLRANENAGQQQPAQRDPELHQNPHLK
jgi:hypothetical protein